MSPSTSRWRAGIAPLLAGLIAGAGLRPALAGPRQGEALVEEPAARPDGAPVPAIAPLPQLSAAGLTTTGAARGAQAPVAGESAAAAAAAAAPEAAIRPATLRKQPEAFSSFAERYPELILDPATYAKVPQAFYSFQDYMDRMLQHPEWGYYATGRVKLGEPEADFKTFPMIISPHFGAMVAEQAFRMWQGMLRAAAMAPTDEFDIVEFGGGDGTLAHDTLLAVRERAQKEPADDAWIRFASRLRYSLYERAPALRRQQAAKNAEFGSQFRSLPGDARQPSAVLMPRSITGLVISNELPDAFGVHKVLVHADGRAEVAFVAPRVTMDLMGELVKWDAPQELLRLIQAASERLAREFAINGGEDVDPTDRRGFWCLDKRTFETLMDYVQRQSPERRDALLAQMNFAEIYLPVSEVPAVAAHLRRNLREYAHGLAHRKSDTWLGYINLDAERYIEDVGRALRAGYVITVDYGDALFGLMTTNDGQRLRTYQKKKAGYDPYWSPTLIDVTTDINFTALEGAGQSVGLRAVHFGQQGALLSGTGVAFEAGSSFRGDSAFKVLVQQKEGTDSAFVYSDEPSAALSRERRLKEIADKLKAGLKGP